MNRAIWTRLLLHPQRCPGPQAPIQPQVRLIKRKMLRYTQNKAIERNILLHLNSIISAIKRI